MNNNIDWDENNGNFPVLFHHSFKSCPWNKWDPQNRNKKEAYDIVNKPGGIGLDGNRPIIDNGIILLFI